MHVMMLRRLPSDYERRGRTHIRGSEGTGRWILTRIIIVVGRSQRTIDAAWALLSGALHCVKEYYKSSGGIKISAALLVCVLALDRFHPSERIILINLFAYIRLFGCLLYIVYGSEWEGMMGFERLGALIDAVG